MRTAVAFAVLILGTRLAPLGTDQPVRAQDRGGAAPLDAEFVKAAAASHLAEVLIGRFGARRATGVEVMRFGQRVVADHAKASEELIKLAVKKRIELPPAVDPEHLDATQKKLSLRGK